MTVSDAPEPGLLRALADVWDIGGGHKWEKSQAFLRLRKACAERYPGLPDNESLTFALHYALSSLGVPYSLPNEKKDLALDPASAAVLLQEAFEQRETWRIHLCPLDCADDLPELAFGPASVGRFTAKELERLVDLPRLQRAYPNWTMDSERLSDFTWMVIREKIRLPENAGQRALPFLYETLPNDFGAIDPHERKFPQVVEDALFALLLAPWEEWGHYSSFEWRVFRIPWTYTLSGDLFVQPTPPPNSGTLSWEPWAYTDVFGDDVEGERPCSYPLNELSLMAPEWVNDVYWSQIVFARTTGLFGAPVAHFLVRAFTSSGIDEFLAHIMVIEAGLGTKIDHDRRSKVGKRNLGATRRVALRLAALLNDPSSAAQFSHLFKTRSEFVHGREMVAIPSEDRMLARRLARRAAASLVCAAAAQPNITRTDFLENLLTLGRSLCDSSDAV